MPKVYKQVKHTGKENNTDKIGALGSKPKVTADNAVTHVVDDAQVKDFEKHVRDYEAQGKRNAKGALNMPFEF
jgi:hypothetical protein